MRLRTKLLAVAGSLAMVGSLAAVGANSASGVALPGVNVHGNTVTCDTLVGTIKFGTGLHLGGNPNVTTNPITIKGIVDGCNSNNVNAGIAASKISGTLTSTFDANVLKCLANGQPTDPPGIGSSQCHGQWSGDVKAIKAKSTTNTLTSVSGLPNPCNSGPTNLVGRGITGGLIPNSNGPGLAASTKILTCDATLKTIGLSADPGISAIVTPYSIDGPDHHMSAGGSFGVNDCQGLAGKTTGVAGSSEVTWKEAKGFGKLYGDADGTSTLVPAVSSITVNQTSGGEFNAVNDPSHPSIPAYSAVTAYNPGDWVTSGGGIYSNLTTVVTNTGHTLDQAGTNNYWAYQGPTSNSDSFGGTYGLFQIGTDALHGKTTAPSPQVGNGAFLGGTGGVASTFDGATGQSEGALTVACFSSAGIKTINFGIGGVHFG